MGTSRSDASTPSPSGTRVRAVSNALVAAPVVAMVAIGWHRRIVVDDGFIYFRIVRQLQAGNGPVFNDGERIETFTGVLWLLWLTAADWLSPLALEWTAVLSGLVLTAGGLALASLGSARLWPGAEAGLLVPLGTVIFVAPYPSTVFATSGLETGLVFFWLGLCWWRLARWAANEGAQLARWEIVVLGLGWLVRPELAVFSAGATAVALWGIWHTAGWRARVSTLVWMLVLPVAYQIFRMAYFGRVVANTATVKDGGSTDLDRGWRYFTDFTRAYWLWVPVVCLGVAALVAVVRRRDGREGGRAIEQRRTEVIAGLFIACGLLLTAYVIAIGGGYLHGRLFLPAFFMLCAPIATVPWRGLLRVAAPVGVWAVLCLMLARPPQLDQPLANGFHFPAARQLVTLADLGWDDDRIANARSVEFAVSGTTVLEPAPGVPLDADAPRPAAVIWAVGATGYALGIEHHVHDRLGLGDGLTAHFESRPPPEGWFSLAAHEKPIPVPWLIARLVDPDAEPSAEWFGPADEDLADRPLREHVLWARASLECGAIDDLVASTTEPLTVGRVVDNFFGAVSRSQVRIPRDPEAAHRRFCGDEAPSPVVVSTTDGA